MQQNLYNLNYQFHEEDLCRLEMKSLFDQDVIGKVFFSSKTFKPCISPFLRNRLKIIVEAKDFDTILDYVVNQKIDTEEFMIKYLELLEGDIGFKKRREICKEIGLRFLGEASFEDPKVMYGITFYNNKWYFGLLEENEIDWKNHNNRPHSYSSSLGIHLAKALVNIGGNGDFNKKIIDPCCGVGTVLLEAKYAGYQIDGCEIVTKVAEHAIANVKYFDYDVSITNGDIKDIKKNYDVSIIDLPYGILSKTEKETQADIIKHAKRISKKVVLVSSDDIKDKIKTAELKVIDYCEVRKSRNHNFVRYIWVCN